MMDSLNANINYAKYTMKKQCLSDLGIMPDSVKRLKLSHQQIIYGRGLLYSY